MPRPSDHGTDQTPGAVSLADVALVVVVATASLVGFIERAKQALDTEDAPLHFLGLDRLGAGLTLVACAALLWRRSFPGWVLLVATLAAVAGNVAGYPPAPLPYAVVVAAFTVGQRWSLAASTVALVPALLAMAVSAFARFGTGVDDEVLTEVLAILAAWALGRQYRLGRIRTRLLEERTRLLEQQAHHLTLEQSTVAALAAAQERATIARELHDVVANDVGVIVAQAGAARRREQQLVGHGSAEVLASIESLGREALTDMRRLVGVLRSIGDDVSAREPGLDRLEHLVAKLAATGTDVRLVVTGDRRPLSSTVELNAYRIVQESLTNAMKHASGSPVRVVVDFGPEQLHLMVRDLGWSAASEPTRPAQPTEPTSGNGLLGMRQRVDLLGGVLRTGPAADGGFVVDCVLPVPAREVAHDGAGADR
ncbi:sensor histidine kinase [Terrabacter terrae]|uniref:sensor histidine kinase n=1 Tax=Terrabacter terrae TaxID=318434 RepID=UPI0031D2B208